MKHDRYPTHNIRYLRHVFKKCEPLFFKESIFNIFFLIFFVAFSHLSGHGEQLQKGPCCSSASKMSGNVLYGGKDS